jgi:hypothetical protein
VTANAYFLSTKRRIKDTFISSENVPKLTYSNLGAKKVSGVNPHTSNKGKRKGKEKERGEGRGCGREGWRRGREERVGKVKCFNHPNLLATRRLWSRDIYQS